MTEQVTVRLTEGGPVRYRTGGTTLEPGDTLTTTAEHAEELLERDGFERVGGPEDSADGGGDGGYETHTPAFDPSEYSVPELEERLDEADLTQDEMVTIKCAEAAGEDRTTALDAIQDRIDEED